jgi:hypothetical protein
MADLQQHALPAVKKLLQSPEDQLYAELGLRRKAILEDPLQAGHFDTEATFDAPFAGPLDTLKEFGQRYFKRVSKDAYSLVCGQDNASAEDRNKLRQAFGLDHATFAAVLAGALVSWFGWAPAIAAVIAVLIVKLFFKSGYDVACQLWKEKLPA